MFNARKANGMIVLDENYASVLVPFSATSVSDGERTRWGRGGQVEKLRTRTDVVRIRMGDEERQDEGREKLTCLRLHWSSSNSEWQPG